MISATLIEFIEIHATQLAGDVARDLATNERTPAFRKVPTEDLIQRVFQIYHHLGNWIGEPRAAKVRDEFSEWGAKRFGQGVPLSEVVFAVIVIKSHLRRFIREHGLVDASFPRAEAEYILPMHLHSLQELNDKVNTFFDEALFYLAQGYERAALSRSASSGR